MDGTVHARLVMDFRENASLKRMNIETLLTTYRAVLPACHLCDTSRSILLIHACGRFWESQIDSYIKDGLSSLGRNLLLSFDRTIALSCVMYSGV